MQRCVAVIGWRRQVTDVLCDVDIFHLRLTAAAYELNQRVMHKAVLILDTNASLYTTARVLASQAEAIVDLRRTWPQHRIDIH